jgi:flagellar export protein FliJ
MKAFRFSLEAVKTLRLRQEQQAMENYLRALLARQQALEHLEASRDQIRRNQQELRRLLTEGCPATQAAQVNQYQRFLEKIQAERVSALGLAERRVNVTFQGMLLARQQRQAVETYRDKELARHQREEAREEQKLLDDMASRRGRSMLAWNPGRVAV